MRIRRWPRSVTWGAAIGILVIVAVVAAIGLRTPYRRAKLKRLWHLPPVVKRMMLELETERVVHRVFPPRLQPDRYAHVTAPVLTDAMRSGADWLLKMQEPSGRFQYWYQPAQHQFSTDDDDNFLRQAGTGFSLTLVYEMTGDRRYLEASRRNLEYLLQFRQDLPPDKSYFLFQDKVKLGGLALPMLTMLKLRHHQQTTEYDDLLAKLANMILRLQEKYGTGQYKSTYVYQGDYQYEKSSGWESRIYPGEAMLALAWMFHTFADPRYKQSIDWAHRFYSDERQWQHHAFLPWTISAFTSMYLQTRAQPYAEYVFQLTDYLLTQQNLDADDEVYGSFHHLPAINTAVYMEGLGDALRVAQAAGDQRRMDLYRERAKLGYRWLLVLQFTPRNIPPSWPQPEFALGGFRSTVFDAQIRIDNTQHAIGAFARGLRNVYGQERAVASPVDP